MLYPAGAYELYSVGFNLLVLIGCHIIFVTALYCINAITGVLNGFFKRWPKAGDYILLMVNFGYGLFIIFYLVPLMRALSAYHDFDYITDSVVFWVAIVACCLVINGSITIFEARKKISSAVVEKQTQVTSPKEAS